MLADQEVSSFFPTKDVGEIHKFFYRDSYRFAAMIDRIMDIPADSHFMSRAFEKFFEDGVLADLSYPKEWY